MLTITSTKKHVKLLFNTKPIEKGSVSGVYRITYSKEDAVRLAEVLVEELKKIGYKEVIQAEDAPYSEEFSTYKNEIERSLSINKTFSKEMQLSLICYTNVESDDNWIELTPKKIKSLIAHIYAYIELMDWAS